jgi:hypothetical protein
MDNYHHLLSKHKVLISFNIAKRIKPSQIKKRLLIYGGGLHQQTQTWYLDGMDCTTTWHYTQTKVA